MKKQNFKKLGYELLASLMIPLLVSLVGGLLIVVPIWSNYGNRLTLAATLLYQPVFVQTEQSYYETEREIIRPEYGEFFAVMKIDAINLEEAIIHGDSEKELAKGVAHYAGSTLPGEGGNVVLSGHRETVFWPLKDIEIGDEVKIETQYGTYTYVVSDIHTTTPDDVSDVTPTDYERLTFYTCYPFVMWGPTPERYMVICDFVGVN